MFEPKKLAAEFVGTAMLVFIAVGVATENFGFKLFGASFAAGVVTTALAFGLVLMALAYAIGPISGAHVNPAVTLGFVAAGRMKAIEGIGYVIAQVAGAIAGAAVLWGIFSGVPGYSRKVQGLGADGYGGLSLVHLNQTGAFVAEVVLTFVFVTVILFATHKAAIQGAAGRGHRHGPGRGPPDRHPADRHLGQPGPEPRPGPHRGRHATQPGLALHRGPARSGPSWPPPSTSSFAGTRRGRRRSGSRSQKPPEPATVGYMELTEALDIRPRPQARGADHHPGQRAAPAVQHPLRPRGRRLAAHLDHRQPGQDGQHPAGPPRLALRAGRQLLAVRRRRGRRPSSRPVAADPHDDTVEQLVAYYRAGNGRAPRLGRVPGRHGGRQRLILTLRPERAYGMIAPAS